MNPEAPPAVWGIPSTSDPDQRTWSRRATDTQAEGYGETSEILRPSIAQPQSLWTNRDDALRKPPIVESQISIRLLL